MRSKAGESVAIGRLERFAADFVLGGEGSCIQIEPVKQNGRRAAIVGSGPAGLACAGELARNGCEAVIYEAFHRPGGVLVYGIPEFRLPKAIVAKDIEKLKTHGVKVVTNAVIGRAIDVDELLGEGFDAVFIATGASL